MQLLGLPAAVLVLMGAILAADAAVAGKKKLLEMPPNSPFACHPSTFICRDDVIVRLSFSLLLPFLHPTICPNNTEIREKLIVI